MTDKTSILDRVRKLLARTTANGATEAEAQSAMAMAQRLMDEHNIAVAELPASGSPGEEFGAAVAWEGKHLGDHYLASLAVIQRVFQVRSLVMNSMKPGKTSRGQLVGVRIAMFGDAVNVEGATWAINFLGPTFKSLWDRHRARTGAAPAARVGYFAGLQDGMLARLDRERDEALRQLPGSRNALAVLSGKLDQAFDALAPQAKAITKATADASAYADGVRDGAEINMARAVGGRGPQALAGK